MLPPVAQSVESGRLAVPAVVPGPVVEPLLGCESSSVQASNAAEIAL